MRSTSACLHTEASRSASRSRLTALSYSRPARPACAQSSPSLGWPRPLNLMAEAPTSVTDQQSWRSRASCSFTRGGPIFVSSSCAMTLRICGCFSLRDDLAGVPRAGPALQTSRSAPRESTNSTPHNCRFFQPRHATAPAPRAWGRPFNCAIFFVVRRDLFTPQSTRRKAFHARFFLTPLDA
jgi:hypothetical protein